MAEVWKVQTNLYAQNISIQSLLTMTQYYNYLLSLLPLFISYFRGELKVFYCNDKGSLEASLHVHNIIIQLASDDAVLQSFMYYHYYISLSLILEESGTNFTGTTRVLWRLRPKCIARHYQLLLYCCAQNGPLTSSRRLQTRGARRCASQTTKARCQWFFQSFSIVWTNQKTKSLRVDYERVEEWQHAQSWPVRYTSLF